jgi:hypothetical protein
MSPVQKARSIQSAVPAQEEIKEGRFRRHRGWDSEAFEPNDFQQPCSQGQLNLVSIRSLRFNRVAGGLPSGE